MTDVDGLARRVAASVAQAIRSALAADDRATIIDLRRPPFSRPEESPCSPSSSTLSPPTD